MESPQEPGASPQPEGSATGSTKRLRSKQKTATKPKVTYTQKFRDCWLQDRLLQDWLQVVEGPQGPLPWCKFCKTLHRNHYKDLTNHAARRKHLRNVVSAGILQANDLAVQDHSKYTARRTSKTDTRKEKRTFEEVDDCSIDFLEEDESNTSQNELHAENALENDYFDITFKDNLKSENPSKRIRLCDKHQTFGDFVADEMRDLHYDRNRRQLRQLIIRAIWDCADMDRGEYLAKNESLH